MDIFTWSTLLLILDYTIRIIAIGLIPENRHPSSSMAWLLIVLLVPVVGLPLFLLLGSPYVWGRRHVIQARANSTLNEAFVKLPDAPAEYELDDQVASFVRMNRRLTSLPAVEGVNLGISADDVQTINEMAAAVAEAKRYVLVQTYIMAWDKTTGVLFEELIKAKDRGVKVHILLDHMGSRPYPGYKKFTKRMTENGLDWHLMMPIKPLKGQWRRPDLRNHRKLVVVDGEIGFMGSQNTIDSSYLKPKNVKVGRHWRDVMIRLSGPIVAQLEAVFVVDWFTESNEMLRPDWQDAEIEELPPLEAEDGDEAVNMFQLVPSGPGFTTEPNLRLFNALINRATKRLVIVSPYFIPDEAMLQAIQSASYRGVEVELYVSEQADQFAVDHAQSSYYGALLDAGIRIFRYPAPDILHSKFFTVDGELAVFGSSNLDMRSFELDYEITLFGTGGDFVASVDAVADQYRAVCKELTAEQWQKRSIGRRYVDNVMRLTSALM